MALLLASVFLLVCVDCCSSPVRPGVGVNILNQVTPEAAPASTRLRLSILYRGTPDGPDPLTHVRQRCCGGSFSAPARPCSMAPTHRGQHTQ